jgi:hypothetical protein
MTDTAELLSRHQPRLYYDSQEMYFADSAAEWTDNPGNTLRRGAAGNAQLLARAGGDPLLSLEFLDGSTYPGSVAVAREDTIGNPSGDYRRQAAALHLQPQYANRIYGHAVTGAGGRVWLQYWFFYFYNDYAVAGFGLHEGDWEMIQLRLGADVRPDLAVYAQHTHAQQRAWAKVERAADDNDAPVVYVARGSHASYFSPGSHWTGVWFDNADGRRRAPRPATLEIVGDASPGWVAWPGYWGDTRPLFSGDPLDQPSPRGPSQHGQWRKPDTLITTAKAQAAKPLPPAPAVPPQPSSLTASRVGVHLELDYSFADPAPGQAAPAKLVVTINSADDRLPPASESFDLVGTSAGGGVTPTARELRDDQGYDIHVSAVSDRGVATAAVALELAAGQESVSWPAPAPL